MDSLLTMLLFQYAADRPGFQGNATFDTSRNALWTAHCTAPLQMDGADGQPAPYLLRGHSEWAAAAACPKVQYRVGETITRGKFVNLDTILCSTARSSRCRRSRACLPHPDRHRSPRRGEDGR